MIRLSLFVMLFTIVGIPAVSAEEISYTIDSTHTRIAFRVSHAGFSHALGTFAGASGTLVFDEDDVAASKLELTLPVASLDLGEAGWNRKVLGGTFLDADRIPQARFTSTAVEKREGDTIHVRGELTLHGVTRPVEFDATVNAVKRHPLTLRKTAGFSAVLRVSRKAFGIDAWESVVGDEVEIWVELEATKARAKDVAAPADAPADAAPPQEDADAAGA